MKDAPTSQERTMAAIAHASIILAGIGPVIPLIVWGSARKKSLYASFQALQAIAYQIIVLWLALLIVLLGFLIGLGYMFASGDLAAAQSDPQALAGIIEYLISSITVTVMGFFSLISFIGAIKCALGNDFYYPFFGKKLESYLMLHTEDSQSLDERREDQLVSAACHTSALVILWGIFTPVLVLQVLKERSAYLKFQAAQALWLQIAMLVFAFLSMTGFFGLAAAGLFILKEYQGDMVIATLVLALVVLIYLILILLILPIFHVYAFIATLRVIQGQEYNYPIIGKRVARNTQTRQKNEAAY